jgi:glycosyltransferase involved in cell wall biosynthesis
VDVQKGLTVPMKPILFIGHNAMRTGAPVLLLDLCRWMARHHPRPFEIVLGSGGELESDYAAIAPTTVIDGLSAPRLQDLTERAACDEFALLYANTVETGSLLRAFASPATPVVTHVHELDTWIRHHTGLDRFNLVCERTDRFVAASDAVRINLVRSHGIDPATVDVVHEFVDTGRWGANASLGTKALDVRRSLGIPDSALVVGGAGTLDWRKGSDIFLQVASAIARRTSPSSVHWLWVGGLPADFPAQAAKLRYDAERLGIAPIVHLIGQQDDPAPFFAAFDLFLLTSREDPYPVVMLEAAALGAPIVCFDRSGGAPEFVEDDCGTIVPYLDVPAMSDAVVELLGSETERRRRGERARTKVRERHDVAVAANRLAAVVEAAIAAGPTTPRLTRVAAPALASTGGPDASASAHTAQELSVSWFDLYASASESARRGDIADAEAAFRLITVLAELRNPEIAGKAFYKRALLASSDDEARVLLERCLTLCPGHGEAARRLAALTIGPAV